MKPYLKGSYSPGLNESTSKSVDVDDEPESKTPVVNSKLNSLEPPEISNNNVMQL